MKKIFFTLIGLCLLTSLSKAQTRIPKSEAESDVREYGRYVREFSPGELTCKIPSFWDVSYVTLDAARAQGTSLRIYVGKATSTDSSLHLILVGLDSNNVESDTYYNLIHPCPSTCNYDSESEPIYIEYCNGLNESPDTINQMGPLCTNCPRPQ